VSIQCIREREKLVLKPSCKSWCSAMSVATNAVQDQGRIGLAE
jgi:hypothetical protein